MRIVDVTAENGVPMDRYGSRGAILARLAVALQEAHLNVMHVEAGGQLGRHPAGVPQLLLVMHGEASVAGGDGERVTISAGQTAVWEAGEEHDTRADTDVSLLVVEAAELHVGDQTLHIPESD